MLGKIVFARRCGSQEPLQPYIVIRGTEQYGEGVTYTVVPENDNFAFETLDIFVSSQCRHRGYEVLGVVNSPEYVRNKIKRLRALFVEGDAGDGLLIDWTEETVATAEETIRLLERSVAALDPPIDEEFDAFGADAADTDDDETEVITDEEADELEARDAGRAAHEARERATQEALARIQEFVFGRQAEHRHGRDAIPVLIIELPEGADTHEQVAAKVQAFVRQQRAEILRRLGVGQ